eukprot:gene12348-8833_t
MLLTTVTLAACPVAALDAVICAEDNLLTAIENGADLTVLRDLEDGNMLLTTFTVTPDMNVRERLMRFEVVARAWLPQRREAYKTTLITDGSSATAANAQQKAQSLGLGGERPASEQESGNLNASAESRANESGERPLDVFLCRVLSVPPDGCDRHQQ